MTSLIARGARGLSELVPAGARGVAAASFRDKPLAAATGLFLADVASPVGRAVNPVANVKGEQVRDARDERVFLRGQQKRAERLQGAVQENIRRIAATDPHLYTQLLRQRRLPRGAVVIGGSPRPDFLEEVAFQMATGGMRKTPPGEDLLDELAQ